MPLHLYYRRKKKKNPHEPSSSFTPSPPKTRPPPSSSARTAGSSICPKFISDWTTLSKQRKQQQQQQSEPQPQPQQMPGGEKELGKIMQLHKEEEEHTARSSPSHTRTPSPRSLDGLLTLPPPSPVPPATRRLPATLLCRRSDGRVLYMEAGKELVDALLGLLTLPLGAALRLLSAADSTPRVGISAVYTSALELDESLLCSDRDALVDPRPGLRPSDLFAPATASASASGPAHIYYKCSNHGCLRFVIDVPGQICPVCKFAMSHKLELIVPGKGPYPPPSPSPAASPLHGSGGSGKLFTSKPLRSGFVKKNRTFIVTDELEILPMSTIRSVILLGKLKLDSLQDLESVQVTVGTTQMLELLKASMSSRTALNDVFRIKAFEN